MILNEWVRQIRRWLTVAFTAAVIVNIVAIALKRYTNSTGLMAVVPLLLELLTGLYLFVLPYATKWRSARRAA
jgi:ascorbate-specific PTS system EIIC-type component UlaA